MPVCIYCKSQRPSTEFSNEHVFTRAFCGTGTNWTLADTVCSSCNDVFSECESHWSHSAAEAMMRAFQGPLGRNRHIGVARQALDVPNLFLIQREHLVAYEGGIAYPPENYLRPQIVEYPPSHTSVCSSMAEATAFLGVVDSFLKRREVFVTFSARRDVGVKYEIARLEMSAADHFEVQEIRLANKAEGLFLRTLLPDHKIVSKSFGTTHQVTRRLVMDDRGRLYARAASPEDIADFLNLLMMKKPTEPPTISRDNKDQEYLIRMAIRLPMVFRCVLKTGLNLLCYVKGNGVALDAAFDEVRIALIGAGGDDVVLRHCKFLDNNISNNPDLSGFMSDGSIDHHEMILDNNNGALRFRLRLYGSTGYVGDLGLLPPNLATGFKPIRARVDFAGAGIQLV